MRGPINPTRRIAHVAAALATLLTLSACHETGNIVVKEVGFSGVHAFKESELRAVLATRQSGWLPWSPRHYFDRAEFEADLSRIHAYYADHGYPAQRVKGVHADVNDDRTSVRVRIDIDEGTPVRVQEVRFEGLDSLPESVRKQVGDVPLKQGAPRDRNQVRATRDATAQLFRDNGYPLAVVDASERPDGSRAQVIVTFRADAGPQMRFGATSVEGVKQVGEDVVRRQLSFEPGELFRERLVRSSQRRLSSLELFDVATITPRTEQVDGDRIPVRISVAEGPPRRLKLGIGYGSEEKIRGTVEWQHVNFFGGARKAEAIAHASFLDQSVKVSMTQPYLGRPGWSLILSGGAEHTRQLTYSSNSYGGRTTVAYRTEAVARTTKPAVRYHALFAYKHEYLRYGIREESLDDLSSREERIALGLDPDTGQGAGTLGSIDFDLERTTVDDTFQPTRGTTASLHIEHAAPWLLGTYRFDEVILDGRAFVPLGSSVLATRASIGTVGAVDPATIPFSQRYFLGGSGSLRGWGRYQVGPIDEQGLPIGGRTLVLLSSELRFPIRDKLSGIAFVDAGQVGASDWSVDQLKIRVDIGPGLRYQTPVGALRVDFGVQLNPVSGLVINGEPERYHWRLHLAIGQAF